MVIDWSAPWLRRWEVMGRQIEAKKAADSGHEPGLFAALNSAVEPDVPVQFVAQTALPQDEAYEAFIHRTGQVPTRDNLHDFFNGLCWLQFPQTKRRLNQLQFEQITHAGVGAMRGAVRDAITVLDENGALLLAPDALWEALLAKDWQRLFVTERALWQQAQLVLFGHALLEKLVQPRKNLVAHVYYLKPHFPQPSSPQLALDSIATLDTLLAADLSVDKLAGKPFAPLPVLGVPGWWPDNEDPAFYDDTSVFRR